MLWDKYVIIRLNIAWHYSHKNKSYNYILLIKSGIFIEFDLGVG